MLLRCFLMLALLCGSVQVSQAQTTSNSTSATQTFPGSSYFEALGLGWLVDYFSTSEADEEEEQEEAEGGCPPCGIDPD